jgi:hypothetical protein
MQLASHDHASKLKNGVEFTKIRILLISDYRVRPKLIKAYKITIFYLGY